MDNTQDAIDVEFETIAASGEKISQATRQQTAMPNSAVAEDDEQLAVFGKKPNTSKNKPMSLPVFTLAASVCAVTAFYLAGGHMLFATTAGPAPAAQTQIESAETSSPLKFEDIISEVIERDGAKIMSVQATILNTDKIAQIIPSVIVHLGDDPTTWRMFRIDRGETLNPGERLVFTNTVRTGDVPDVEPKLSFSE